MKFVYKIFHDLYFDSSKKTPTKRKRTPIVKPIIKKKPRQESTRGSRRSARLALKRNSDEEESTDDEVMDVS
jgi:hypothetical protein